MASVIRGSDNFDSAGIVDGAAKAWVNFDGSGTVAIRDSFNVSSIDDNGSGNYAVNFTTAFPDTNYCTVSAAGISGNYTGVKTGNAVTTGYITIDSFIPGGVWTDAQYVSVAVFG